MDSFNETSGFCYDPNPDNNGEGGFSGLLEIYVSHARNIHNICIYDNQDVYAKFSLTYNPDETISTRIVNGGGKNPQFNENLKLKITQLDAVLKCEIWMLSRARNYLDDQLLGFTLVPMSLVAGKGKVTQVFTLSSTDLFHSPAGTVELSLFLNTSVPVNLSYKASDSVSKSSIASEVVLLDRGRSDVVLDPVEYGRIEFPDMNVARENQQMVSEYFHIADRIPTMAPILCGHATFLNLSSTSQRQSIDDFDMNLNSSSMDNNSGGSVSPNGSTQNSGFFSSTTTSLSEDRNSIDSTGKKSHGSTSQSASSHVALTAAGANQTIGGSPDTPTSKKESGIRSEKDEHFSSKEGERGKGNDSGSSEFGQVFAAPLGNINLEAEQTAMQQQIVDMYMRSMQQFTESLAKMKLPMDLDKQENHDPHGDVIQQHNKKIQMDKKKDGSRVFYGSRAFF
ncbi:hypothetical protein Scep_003977 [Stephania cephalantha]|uniref:C2 domain-containing protein n=1 Tax=Stephania cephalantha TaxID=152367 RepID=A0AAP0PUZ8_9MAGN